MGGILTKEMLAKALTDAAPGHRHDLATTAAGLVFYATPHVGSWLADIGWTLRFVGASLLPPCCTCGRASTLRQVQSWV